MRRLFWPLVASGTILLALSPGISSDRGPLETESQRLPAPRFRLPVVGGGHWSLAEHRGRVVVVNFWAAWCPPCRLDVPVLVRIHERFAGRPVDVVGISLDENAPVAVPPFAARLMRYPVLLPDSQSSMVNGIAGLPSTWIIDAGGRIAHRYSNVIDEARVAADLERLLEEK